jgi:hypothetical protein
VSFVSSSSPISAFKSSTNYSFSLSFSCSFFKAFSTALFSSTSSVTGSSTGVPSLVGDYSARGGGVSSIFRSSINASAIFAEQLNISAATNGNLNHDELRENYLCEAVTFVGSSGVLVA